MVFRTLKRQEMENFTEQVFFLADWCSLASSSLAAAPPEEVEQAVASVLWQLIQAYHSSTSPSPDAKTNKKKRALGTLLRSIPPQDSAGFRPHMRKIQEMCDSLSKDTKRKAVSALHRSMISGTTLKRSVSAALQRPEPQPMIVRDPNNPSLTLNAPKDVAQTFAHTLQHLGGDPDYHPPAAFVSKVLAHTPPCPTTAPNSPVSHIAWKDYAAFLHRAQPTKAGGDDHSSSSILHISPEPVKRFFWIVSNIYLYRELPPTWLTAPVCLLYKKGDPLNPVNYRPIALLNTIYKTISAHIARHLQSQALHCKVQSDSDGSPQLDERHDRRSRSRSPVSPGYAGETLAELEERRLAEAAVQVGQPAGEPRAAPADPKPSTKGPAPTEETAPAAQAANPAALPTEGAPGAQRAETAAPAGHATAPADHAAAPGTPPAQGVAPARARSASPGAATAAAGGRQGAKYRAHTNLSHTHTSPPKPYPPKAAFTKGRPRPVRPPAPERTPPGITLPQQQRQQDTRCVIGEGGDDAQTGQGVCHGSAERGTGGDRGSAQEQAQGTGLGEGVGKAPKPAAAETGRARAAGGTTRHTERGKGKGTQRTRRDASRAPRRAATERMERNGVRSTNGGAAENMGKGTGRIRALAVRARARVTEDGTQDVGGGEKARGPGRDPKARGGRAA